VGVPTHGVEGVILTASALKNRQLRLETRLKLSQHALPGGGAKHGPQAAAGGTSTVYGAFVGR
jgi:hypothetical protein